MRMTLDFRGRLILVCGVARGGIGGATVRALAGLGARLACVDRTQDVLDPTLADIRDLGAEAIGIVADLTDPAQTDGIIGKVLEAFGRLDGVVNVAGGTREGEWGPLEESGVAGFRDTVSLNLEYVFSICTQAARSMVARSAPAPIVNVGSISSLNSAPFHGPYGAAKAGLNALTRTMAFEWARHGIRVNVVSPGAVPSERVLAKGLTPDAVRQEGAINDVVQTTADEIAGAILFLLSDLATGVSGHNLVVDSGITTRNAVLPIRMDAVKASMS
ncbi:SDR family NAD(P)-dependent oxidoreductase [Sphingomonas sp. ID0503]|uniref:SDR family NAD(P)-dependent oxidoreductase n=1 Tax=Sphingomonas sp. ID0503 TaxID=3399691 RepID=UPI003AFB3B3F